MKKLFLGLSLCYIIVLCAVDFSMPLVRAQSITGLTISPVKTEISTSPGKTETVTIIVKNNSTASKQVTVQFDDFEPAESGEPKILSGNEKNQSYGLNNFATGLKQFTVAPSASYNYKVTISIPKTAEGKTRYGAVVFKPNADAGQQAASVGSLLLINIGTLTSTAKITGLKLIDSSLSNLAKASATFEMSIQNDGDYMIKPVGSVTIKDDTNKIVAVLKTTDQASILPKSLRKFTLNWNGALDPSRTYKVEASATQANGSVITNNSTPLTLYKSAPPANTTPAQVSQPKKMPFMIIGIALAVLLSILVSTFLILRGRQKKLTATQPLTNPAQAGVTQPTITPSSTPLITPQQNQQIEKIDPTNKV